MTTGGAHVAIVGSGLAGTTMAWALTRAGHRVTIFEKGPEYPYPHVDQFEGARMLDPRSQRVLARDLKHHTRSGQLRFDPEHDRFMNVGGSASRWSGITPRMTPPDFATRTRFGYGRDWPLSYDELEPYYGRAEAQLGVSGTDEDNPYAPPRSRPHPLPPFELGYDDLLLAERLAAAGLHLHTTPQARTRHDYDERPGCKNNGRCFVCPIGARYSPNHHLERLLASGLATLHTETSVRRILLDKGRARTIVYRPHGAKADREAAFDAVVVAAGSLESARLLLLSAQSGHADGLGNGSGRVGAGLVFHHLWRADLRFDRPLHSGGFGGWTGQSQQFVNAATRGRHCAVKIELSSVSPNFLAVANRPWVSIEKLHEQLAKRMHFRPIVFHAEAEIDEEKWVGLSEETDRFGDPFVHLHYVATDLDRATYDFVTDLVPRFANALEAEVERVKPFEHYGSGAHHMGTCAMGDDPANSVTDRFGRVHGIANLYLAGECTFVGTSGASNPSLTLTALALRSADHLLDRLG